MSTHTPQRIRVHVAVWSVGGIALAFVDAIARLGYRGWRVVEAGLTGPQWLALAVIAGFLGYIEGYRALHCRFAPAVVARAIDLAGRPLTARSVLGPLYAASLISSDRGSVARAWAAVAAIAGSVAAVRTLPGPWRGIVDLAVAVALSWGLVALVARFAEAVRFPATAQPQDPTVANIQP